MTSSNSEFHVGACTIPLEAPPSGTTDDWGKKKRLYAAKIVGSHAKWGLDRDFASAQGIISSGQAKLDPTNHRGVFEVVDFPNGDKRRRYYALHDKNVVETLWSATTQDVLDALDRLDDGDVMIPVSPLVAAAAATVDAEEGQSALVAKLDEIQGAFEAGEYDQEDALMYLDQLREIVERIH